MSDERREFSRVSLAASASFELPDGATAVGQVVDLSMTGVAFACAVQPETGTVGGLAVVFGEGVETLVVRASAKVAWSTPTRVGLEIVEVDLDSYYHLRNLILYNSGQADRIQEELDSHMGLKRR